VKPHKRPRSHRQPKPVKPKTRLDEVREYCRPFLEAVRAGRGAK
jgi:hypothetical protein